MYVYIHRSDLRPGHLHNTLKEINPRHERMADFGFENLFTTTRCIRIRIVVRGRRHGKCQGNISPTEIKPIKQCITLNLDEEKNGYVARDQLRILYSL